MTDYEITRMLHGLLDCVVSLFFVFLGLVALVFVVATGCNVAEHLRETKVPRREILGGTVFAIVLLYVLYLLTSILR